MATPRHRLEKAGRELETSSPIDLALQSSMCVSPNKGKGVGRETKELALYLKSEHRWVTLPDAKLRQIVVQQLNELVKAWVQGVCRKHSYPEDVCRQANASIHTFGSYRLGVHAPGSDIDTLVVAPKFADRDSDFFGNEPHCLQYILSHLPEVTEVQALPNICVPILSLKFRGIKVDLLYARLQLPNVDPNLSLMDTSLLHGCDQQSVLSLNGCRTALALLQLVPHVDTFRLALRAMKFWAERRGLASGAMGYLGGINLAILVAKVCQWHPSADAGEVLQQLFRIMSQWQWPQPISLNVPEKRGNPMLDDLVWDPKTSLFHEQMVLLTPVYPAMNSAFSVSHSTRRAIVAEFQRGHRVCQEILQGQAGRQASPPLQPTAPFGVGPRDEVAAEAQEVAVTQWAKLFEPVDFFRSHDSYIQVEVSADTDADLAVWDGYISSRMRRLTLACEQYRVCARPFPTPQECPWQAQDGRPRLFYFVGIEPWEGAGPAQALSGNIRSSHGPGSYWAYGRPVPPAPRLPCLDLPIREFQLEVTYFQGTRPGMSLQLQHIARRHLPQWLHAPTPMPIPAKVASARKTLLEDAVSDQCGLRQAKLWPLMKGTGTELDHSSGCVSPKRSKTNESARSMGSKAAAADADTRTSSIDCPPRRVVLCSPTLASSLMKTFSAPISRPSPLTSFAPSTLAAAAAAASAAAAAAACAASRRSTEDEARSWGSDDSDDGYPAQTEIGRSLGSFAIDSTLPALAHPCSRSQLTLMS